jgi:hypothetical protein
MAAAMLGPTHQVTTQFTSSIFLIDSDFVDQQRPISRETKANESKNLAIFLM